MGKDLPKSNDEGIVVAFISNKTGGYLEHLKLPDDFDLSAEIWGGADKNSEDLTMEMNVNDDDVAEDNTLTFISKEGDKAFLSEIAEKTKQLLKRSPSSFSKIK